jgi:hypothetical protein
LGSKEFQIRPDRIAGFRQTAKRFDGWQIHGDPSDGLRAGAAP